jgi:hypothetical protein
MLRCTFVFIFVAFHLIGCLAQETLSVTKPLLEIQGGNLVIKYDILNSKPGEKYSISLDVTDSRGSVINAKSFSGDIGDNIDGGKNKRIIWRFADDNVKDEVNIYVKIIIKRYVKGRSAEGTAGPAFLGTRGGLVLQSIALPGLGLSKIKNKPYWIMGVAGYGLIGSSIVFRMASNTNYDNFENTNDPEEESTYYTKYKNQKSISTACAIGAATIWVADLILVLRASSKSGNPSGSDQNNKLFVIPDYIVSNNAPALTLKYVF